MRKNIKGKKEEEIKNELVPIIQIFSLLTNKSDVLYDIEKQMTERLIKEAYVSLYAEKKFISMLKQEIGVYYTKKMSTMISDLDESNKEKEIYNKLKDNNLPNDIKFDIFIISQGSWNINRKYFEKMKIPKFLKYFMDDFEKIYKNRYKSRGLFWLNGLSKINIKYLCFENNNYESKSTLLQYLILLEIEKHGKLKLEKIAENIDCKVSLILEDISGLIFNQSFNPQHKSDKGILLGNFDEKTIEFKGTDEVWFNFNFNNIKNRFNTMPLNIKKSEKQIKEEEKEDEIIKRKYQDNIIQSTITRIMKAKNGKKVQHSWLINEVSNQVLLFKAQPQQIKENIEKVIEKNIIKRDEKDVSYYLYIS